MSALGDNGTSCRHKRADEPDARDDPLLHPARLARFLEEHDLPPLHRFGQHFLVDAEVLAEMVRASATDPRIPVIEIGAGLGILTRALAQARRREADRRRTGCAPLIAVELDRRLVPLLHERVRGLPSVRVVQADVLTAPQSVLLPSPDVPQGDVYDVVGNIPYNITAPIVERFLAHDRKDTTRGTRRAAPARPRRMTMLVDDTVASALAASPPDMSLRAISVQVYAEPTVVRRRIPPTAFIPPPAVHSAIVSLVVRPVPLIPPTQRHTFFSLVRAGFSHRRKMLTNALAAPHRLVPADVARRLHHAGILPARRAQTLSIEEWGRLARVWHA